MAEPDPGEWRCSGREQAPRARVVRLGANRGLAAAARARPVPFLSPAAGFEALWPLIARHVGDVTDRGRESAGSKVAELERAIAACTGARHAIGMNSRTDALVVLLRACGVRPGDEVIVPAFAFAAAANAVVVAGARPVFADIDPETYSIDPDAVAAAVTPRTRAVMPIHLFSQMADMDAVRAVARDRGLVVVEGSAQAVGLRWNGVHAGLLGAGGMLSFFPAVTLSTIGDASMIVTDDPGVAERAAALRDQGRQGRMIDRGAEPAHASWRPGGGDGMHDLQAAVLMANATRPEADVARLAGLAARYERGLQDLPGVLRLPPLAARTPTRPVFHVYVIEVEGRDALAERLAQAGIGTEVPYRRSLHLLPCFRGLGHQPTEFPRARAACQRTLALPLYPDLARAQVDRVCHVIRDFFGARPW